MAIDFGCGVIDELDAAVDTPTHLGVRVSKLLLVPIWLEIFVATSARPLCAVEAGESGFQR